MADEFDLSTLLWVLSAASALTVVVAALAERRRTRRRNLDRVGWMPWNLIQILAFFAAVACAGLAVAL